MTTDTLSMKTCADCGTVTSKLRRDMCNACYLRWYTNVRTGAPRCIADCDKPKYSKKTDYCHMHKRRLERGSTTPEGVGRGRPGVLRGKSNMLGYYVNADGYRKIRLSGIAGDKAWVLEHRHVMEQSIGRKLVKGETVHHKNGDKLDNRIENLELWVSFQPAGQRPEDLLAYAYEIIERYGK